MGVWHGDEFSGLNACGGSSQRWACPISFGAMRKKGVLSRVLLERVWESAPTTKKGTVSSKCKSVSAAPNPFSSKFLHARILTIASSRFGSLLDAADIFADDPAIIITGKNRCW
ncbi:hypothetical protein HNY73_001862 [Argiope bruennichi]|uniref:Uncharacterized protein n=1 Tax=Argiope bruennichi TaxID=94029 RepID=A0A8T0FRN3_ARGBR|nr:hypothetical protein HNY73_001862 [Argiope bruennichi]